MYSHHKGATLRSVRLQVAENQCMHCKHAEQQCKDGERYA